MQCKVIPNLLLISYFIIILSLAGLAYIVSRKIPILMKLPLEPDSGIIVQKQKITIAEKAVDFVKEKIAHPNYLLVALGWLEKSLRKTRILFLKIDRYFISLISKSREKSREVAVKSKGWISQRRMKKIERLKMLADLRRTTEEKEEMLLSILKQNPKDIKAYKELGSLYLEQGNAHDAKAAFEETLKLNPDDELANEKIGEIEEAENKNNNE